MSSLHLAVIILQVAYGIGVFATVTEVPTSQNASAGQLVMFSCATNDSNQFVTWNTVPHVGNDNEMKDPLPTGGERSVIEFTAMSDTDVKCIVVNQVHANVTIKNAKLLVQGPLSTVGDLESAVVDHCTLRINWTAPYTLQGVPINYYTVSITRQSDGAVLLASDTANDTEYFHSVIILGETLEISVAAVNGAGAGNVSTVEEDTPTSISNLTLVNIVKSVSTMKSVNMESMSINWTYTLELEEELVCGPALNDTHTVEVCLVNASFSNNCSSVSGIVNNITESERSVAAEFTDLVENRNYHLTLNLEYNGGVSQESRTLNISTFDVRKVLVYGPIVNGRVCLNITYVQGSETLECFIFFDTGIEYNINGTSGCIPEVPPGTYNMIATDAEAKEQIDIAAAVTIQVTVPYYTMIVSSVVISPSTSAIPSPIEMITLILIITIPSLIVGGIIIIVIIIICLYRLIKKKKQPSTSRKSSPTTSVPSIPPPPPDSPTHTGSGRNTPPDSPTHTSPTNTPPDSPTYSNPPTPSPDSPVMETKF